MIELRDASKVYWMGDSEVRALDRVNLTIETGELVAIMGRPGRARAP
jgi:putative ABC transport system ATP-binding protein